MHKEVHQWTREQKCIRQKSNDMGPVFRNQKIGNDQTRTPGTDPIPFPAGIALCRQLSFVIIHISLSFLDVHRMGQYFNPIGQ